MIHPMLKPQIELFSIPWLAIASAVNARFEIPLQQFLVKVGGSVRVDFDAHFWKLLPECPQEFRQPLSTTGSMTPIAMNPPL